MGEDLPAFAREDLGPFKFVRARGDRAFPTAARWLDGLPMHALRFVDRKVYPVGAHWALWVENYLEGLHVPFVHPGLRASLDLAGYITIIEDDLVIQIAPGRTGGRVPLPAAHPARAANGQDVAGLYLFLFPCTALNLYDWGVSVNSVEPVSATSTRIHYERWEWAHTATTGVGPGDALDDVELEDDAIVERVQAGVTALLATGGALGSYAPAEAGARAFHRWLAELVSAR